MEYKYRFLIDEMTDEEIAEETKFLKEHNWTPKNAGFDFKTLIKSMNPYWLPLINSKNMVWLIGGAKGFGKSFFAIMIELFEICNFTDVNNEFLRDKDIDAFEQLATKFWPVISIVDNNGANLFDIIEGKKLELQEAKSTGTWQLNFPNKRRFRSLGFDNRRKWAGIDSEKVGGTLTWYWDEVIAQDYAEKPIIDQSHWVKNLIIYLTQKVRTPNVKTFDRELKMLTAEVTYSFQNSKGETITRTDIVCYKKMKKFIASFNNHDTSQFQHPIKELFLEDISSSVETLDKTGFEIFDVPTEIEGLGLTAFFGSTAINPNLSPEIDLISKWTFNKRPELAQQIFGGGELQLGSQMYSYKKYIDDRIKNDNLFIDKFTLFYEDIIFGIDYADSKMGKDDVSIVMLGIKHKKNYVEKIVVLNSIDFNSKNYSNLNNMLTDMSYWVIEQFYIFINKRPELYCRNHKIKVRFGQDSRTIAHNLHKEIFNNIENQYFVAPFFDTMTASGVNGWSIDARENIWRLIISDNRLVFDKELSNYLDRKNRTSTLLISLLNCQKAKNSDRRDESQGINHLDPINAFEHALSYYRNWL